LLQELRDELGASFPENPRVVFTTTATNEARVRLDELLAGMLEPLGIMYVSELEPPGEFFTETLDCATWDVGEWAWVGAPGLSGLVSMHEIWDPGSLPASPGGLGSNYYRWGTAGLGLVQPSTVQNESTERFATLYAQ
jgi:hypothetical protein